MYKIASAGKTHDHDENGREAYFVRSTADTGFRDDYSNGEEATAR
jgi:hypothetical protein